VVSGLRDKRLSVFGLGGEEVKILLVAPAWGNAWIPSLQKAFEDEGHEALWAHNPEQYNRLKYWYGACLSMWADEFAIKISHEAKKPFYTYIRAYEAFTEMPSKINWANVKGLFYCNPNTANIAGTIFNKVITSQNRNLQCYMVLNWIDATKYPFKQRENGTDIAMVCDLNFKKNIPLAIQVLAELPEEYTLHIAGQCQDESLAIYMENLILDLGLEKRVKMYDRIPQKDIPAFLDDKNYILSTSMREGCPMSVLEAMAMGIKPVIHNWPGAKNLYHPENIFSKISEVKSILDAPYESEMYQATVERNHSLNNAKEVVRIVTTPHIIRVN
jgi:glycosyltransferase involved in cell wall biosynthesis